MNRPRTRHAGRLPAGHYRNLFLSVPDPAAEGISPEGWARMLRRELGRHEAAGVEAAPTLSSLLVGGARPGSLGRGMPAWVETVLGEAVAASEWTIEVDALPADDSVRAWVDGGLTRVCVRADPHRPGGGWDSVRLGIVERVAAAGAPRIAADLLVGLHGDSPRDLADAVARLVDAGVGHVSVYEAPELTVEGAEKFEVSWHAVLETLVGRGFVSDDLVNHSLPGQASRFSRALLHREPMLGLGPGARSFRNPRRIWNVRTWREYAAALASGADPSGGSERLSPDEVRMERIWCRLQTGAGLRLPETARIGERVEDFVKAGWACRDGSRLRLTPAGWLRLDALAVEISASLDDPARREAPPF